tara:strand:+ start:720 stop:1061 length:342 start_codon:yes stop_codon:yes gene_type:complete
LIKHNYNKGENLYYIIQTTTNDKNTALKISKILVKEKISACAQIVENVISTYRWNENIEFQNEYILQIKCKKLNLKKIINIITENHNYDVPEIIYFSIGIANEKYKIWLDKNC